MSTDSRTTLMAKLRGASQRDSDRPADSVREELARQLSSLGEAPVPPLPREDLGAAFLHNVRRNGGSVDAAVDRPGAVKAVARFLYQKYRTQKLAVGNDPRLAALPWRDGGLLPRFEPAEDGEQAALSYARLGVVETGSTVAWTGKTSPARNLLLPESHIVLVDQSLLVATLEQAWDRLDLAMQEGGRPRGIHLVSGPSSTADIDMQLVEGAHGPRCWHVILLGEAAPAALEDAGPPGLD